MNGTKNQGCSGQRIRFIRVSFQSDVIWTQRLMLSEIPSASLLFGDAILESGFQS